EIRRENGVTVAKSKSLGKNTLPIAKSDIKLLHEQGRFFKHLELGPMDQTGRATSYRLLNYLVQKQYYPVLVLQVAVPETFIESQRRSILPSSPFPYP